MPLVLYYRAARILKQKRAKRLKGRPKWQDEIPPEKELRDAYSIAAANQASFSRAFLEAIRNLITPEIEKRIREAWKSGSPAAVVNAIPYFEADPEEGVWKAFTDRLSAAYLTVIQQSGDAATRETSKALKVKLAPFAALPPEDATEEVAIAKSMADVRHAAVGMTVGVNPYSIKWVNERGLELITQSITAKQRQLVADIIERAMEEGIRPTEMIRQIRENIGLTPRYYQAVENRRILHQEAGLAPEKVEELTGKYREKLLRTRAETIARTETIAAQAQGRQAAWQLAQESGNLPPVQRRWISAGPSPNPSRPCDICLSLDGSTAVLGEPYDSPFAGMIEAPPAHPDCRCSETLERIP